MTPTLPAMHLPTAAAIAALSLTLGASAPSLAAQTPPAQSPAPQATESAFGLATLYDMGHLVIDTNGDDVPDAVNGVLLLGPSPSLSERLAAAEISARLGFETMALSLPLPTELADGQVGIAIGESAVRAAGIGDQPGFTEAPAAGSGLIQTGQVLGRRWIAVRGSDDESLLKTARHLAGVLPHTESLSSPSFSDVESDVAEVEPGATVLVTSLRIDQNEVTAFGSLTSPSGGAPALEARLAADSLELEYAGLDRLVLATASGSVELDVSKEKEPGPVSSRPGSGGKGDMDLSNLYSPAGLLGDSDSDLIPDRVDVQILASETGTASLSDLAARLGLEATGLTLPLTRTIEETESPGRAPTLLLAGSDNPLTQTLLDSGRIVLEDVGPGEGLIRLVEDAHGEKPALVVTGSDAAGSDLALTAIAETFPNLGERGKDRPTFDDVEMDLWQFFSGRSPAGQAAIGLYKLNQILAGVTEGGGTDVEVLMSLEKPDPGLESAIRRRVESQGLTLSGVSIDNRDVENAATIFEDRFTVPSEVDRLREAVAAALNDVGNGDAVTLRARVSEPPEIRRALEPELSRTIESAGGSPSVQVLSAYKQAYSWLDEEIKPLIDSMEADSMVLRFRRNTPPPEWPQQAMTSPARWAHEAFPFDEVFARDTRLGLENIRLEMTESGPTYEVTVFDDDGDVLLRRTFEPKYVLRPYFDRFQDYEHVRVTTGWLSVDVNGQSVADDRIITDPEWFWDRFQAETLHDVYDYVMDRHRGRPRGGEADAPFFGSLTVDLSMSEPERPLGIDKEYISSHDAIHEEVYFGTLEFFQLLGRHSRGQDLQYAGRVLPIMRPASHGADGQGVITLTGFATNRPAVIVTWTDSLGARHKDRLDIPKINMRRPSLRRAVITADGLKSVAARVRVDTDADVRDSLLTYAPPESVDERMVSAEQVTTTLRILSGLRAAGLYSSSLAQAGLGEIEVWAEWTHDEDPEARQVAILADNGTPSPAPNWRSLLAYRDGPQDPDHYVQWEEPIPPPEGHAILARMANDHPEVQMYQVGNSYLGKDIWAADLMPEISGTHWSHAKATTFKPTVVYSARQHANEVSSTSHVLRHAELLLTDSVQRAKLNKVNVIIHPFTNPDGAQLAYDLYRITPDFILHAGYLASLGMDATSGSNAAQPIYPESQVRPTLWNTWLPDIFLNPHGYPSRQLVQLFSEYQGLVRRGRVTERNWGFNKGWFMPGFGYIDDPRYPRHKDAAFTLRDYITRGINSNRDVFDMNQRNYARYRRYGVAFDPDVFRTPMSDSVMIEMPLKGSGPPSGGRGYNPRVTIWSGVTEAPDETAYGPWMELVAKAGLSWDQAILDYLVDGNHKVNRSGSTFFGGVSLKMKRPRPPEPEEEAEPEESEPPGL